MTPMETLLALLTLFLWLSGSFVGIALSFAGMLLLAGGHPGGYIWAIIVLAFLPRVLPRPLRLLATIAMWIMVAAVVGYGSWLAAVHSLGMRSAICAAFTIVLLAGSLWSEFRSPAQPRKARAEATPKPPRIEPYLRRPAARLTIEGRGH